MNGPQNERPQSTKNQRRKQNRQRGAQSEENSKESGEGKTQTKKTKEEGEKTQAGSKKQAQKAGTKKRSKEKGLILVQEKVLQDLPVLGPPHLAALSNHLSTISTNYGMSKADVALRWQVFSEIKKLFEREIKGCSLRLYGSSKSCLGLRTSDVNVDVNEENEEKIPRIFIIFLNVLKGCNQYSEIKEEFESKWPVINFKDVKSGLTCKISTGNNFAFFTNSLLKIYSELDNRVKPLCHCFRLWAKICGVDHQAAGTLPPHSFFLMVVHFLQQVEPPLLPVIHEKLGDELTKYFVEDDSNLLTDVQNVWKTENKSCLGELWLGLLRFYCNYEKNETFVISIRQIKKMAKSEKNSWGKRKFAIEDPFSTKKNVARTVLKNNAYRYIVEHLKVALVYFSRHPDSPLSGTQLKVNNDYDSDRRGDSKNVQKSSASKGWVRPQSSTEEEVEVACSESDEGDQGNRDEDEVDSEAVDEDDEDGGEDPGGDHTQEDLIDGIFALDIINDSPISDVDEAEITAADESLLNDSNCLYDIAKNTNNGLLDCDRVLPDVDKPCTPSSDLLDVDWKKAVYLFDDSVLRKSDALETKCAYCGEEGHIVDNCTAEKVTRTLKPLPNVPDWFKIILNEVCYCCKDDFGITQEDVRRRHFYLRALEAYITKFLPTAKLHLFGSSCNGFGFTGSDIDLCMTLEGKTKNDINCIEMITWLAGILKKNPECSDVIAITGAKVPIVKFLLRHGRVEADISMYNEVALWNTKLLAAYVRIDPRVHVLGCTLKIFVKLCDIGDASRGSLSSYAYILMLLHFLQQRQPPVLPVLQELYDTPEQPLKIVEGHNCWFYDDLENLGKKWTARNTENCGELWLGFLRYYTEEFDFRRNVVCIRYLKPLTKFEKLWNGRQICIEDPFVLSHNLGAALSLGMVKFIRSTFEKARDRFGTARQDIPVDVQARQRFFFNTFVLNDGNMPPIGRNCNVCGKIGHWAKECPYNRSRRDKNRKEQQNKAGKSQQNKSDKSKTGQGQQNAEKGQQNKDEKILQNDLDKGLQKKAEKTPQSNYGKGQQSSENNQENKDLQRNGKTQKIEQQKDKLKDTKDDIANVVQNVTGKETVASGLMKTPGHQGIAPQVRPSILPPQLLKQGQFPQLQPHPQLPINPPSVWPYQPLSPPISPGSPLDIVLPMQPPLPMSNPLATVPRPLMDNLPRTPLGYQQHGLVHSNIPLGSPRNPVDMISPVQPYSPMSISHSTAPNSLMDNSPGTYSRCQHGLVHSNVAPGSPPIQYSSPMRSPISSQVRPRPSNPLPVSRPPFCPPSTGTVCVTPPQSGVIPITQLFDSTRNPFAFNFLPFRDVFLNKPRPLYQPFEPAQPIKSSQNSPEYVPLTPVAEKDSLTKSPGVFSCEELEREDGLVPPLQRNHTDGVPGTPEKHANSFSTVKKVPTTNYSPTVADSFRSLNINTTSSQRTDQCDGAATKPETKCSAIDEIESFGSEVNRGHEKANQEFQTPPKVQNIAATFPSLNERDIATSRGETLAFKAEYTEETSSKTSRRRRRRRKQNPEQIQGEKTGESLPVNVPQLKESFVGLPPQQQQPINVGDERVTAKTPPLSKELPQGQNAIVQQETTKKTPGRQVNRKQPIQNAYDELQQLQQSEQAQKQPNNTRQQNPNKSPTNQMKSNHKSQHKELQQQQQHKKQQQQQQQKQQKQQQQQQQKKQQQKQENQQQQQKHQQNQQRQQQQQQNQQQQKQRENQQQQQKEQQNHQKQQQQQQQQQQHRKPREVKILYKSERQTRPFDPSAQQLHSQHASQQVPTHEQDNQQQYGQQGASQYIKSPKRNRVRQDRNVPTEKTPTKLDQAKKLVINLTGDQREVKAEGLQNSPVNDANKNTRKRRRKRPPRSDGAKEVT